MVPTELTPLLNVGSVGLVLAWFMFKAEPRLDAIEQAIDRNTRSNMLVIMALEHVSEPIKHQAQSMLEEITDAEKRRQRK